MAASTVACKDMITLKTPKCQSIYHQPLKTAVRHFWDLLPKCNNANPLKKFFLQTILRVAFSNFTRAAAKFGAFLGIKRLKQGNYLLLISLRNQDK